MKTGSILFGIIGTIVASIAATNLKETKINNMETKETEIAIKKEISKPKIEELYGTYSVKSDRNTKLTLKDDGTYYLIINVCDDYLSLNGKYEVRDTKLKLYNTNFDYNDLDGNTELSFEIVDKKAIKSEESLICTPQETLFEK